MSYSEEIEKLQLELNMRKKTCDEIIKSVSKMKEQCLRFNEENNEVDENQKKKDLRKVFNDFHYEIRQHKMADVDEVARTQLEIEERIKTSLGIVKMVRKMVKDCIGIEEEIRDYLKDKEENLPRALNNLGESLAEIFCDVWETNNDLEECIRKYYYQAWKLKLGKRSGESEMPIGDFVATETRIQNKLS